MIPMPNNLNQMIRQANMTKREVAALKGITPENLSRQVNGHTNITLADAEHYAKILNCTPQQVLFVQQPADIIGFTHSDANETLVRDISPGTPRGKIWGHAQFHRNYAVVYSTDDDYYGRWSHWNGAICFMDRAPIDDNRISKDAIGRHSWCKLSNGPTEHGSDILFGNIFPEPGNLYTIDNPEIGRRIDSQKLDWATPNIINFMMPDMRELQIVMNDKQK